MHRIDHPTATIDNKFTPGNPQTSVKPTVVTADWANAVQEEVSSFIESRGLALDKEDNTQLAKAIESAITINDENVIIANNQTDASLGAKFSFDINQTRRAVIECDVYRKDSTQEKYTSGEIHVVGNLSTGEYELVEDLMGDIDDIGLDLTIENVDGVGTVKYDSTDYAGANYEGKMTFKIKKFKI